MTSQEHKIFSIPIKESICPFFDEVREDIIQDILSMSEKQDKDVETSIAAFLKSNLKESSFDLHLKRNKNINRIFDWIRLEINDLNYNLSGNVLDSRITESWYHVTEYGGYHGTHQHSNCSWCAIFYVEPGDDNSGYNIFQSKESPGYIDPGYFWWIDSIKIKPEAGKLVLFPSMIMHSAEPYLGREKKRIVISCNTVSGHKR